MVFATYILFVFQKEITEALLALRRNDLELSEMDWDFVRKMLVVLDRLAEVTTNLCSQHYPSIFKMIPSVCLLQLHLLALSRQPYGNPSIDKLAADLHCNRTNRFKDI